MKFILPVASGEKLVYTPLAIFLHWFMGFIIFGMIPLGWYMLSIEDEPGSDWYFRLHKSIGLIFSILILLRLMWRFFYRSDSLKKNISNWQNLVLKITHWLLYVAMLFMPISGIIGALLSKGGLSFFGAIIPRVILANHDMSEFFFSLHAINAWILVALISLHIAGALKHFIAKDGVFLRMWPSGR